jgi:intracellular sulfur oxidation DsrE/DsrF family protein
MKMTFALVCVGLTAGLFAADSTGKPEYEHPLIEGVGGIVVLSEAAEQPEPNSKVILDITSDKMAGNVIKGLDRAALITNLYAKAGVGPDEGMRMAVILHGPATKAALSDEAYVAHSSSYARQSGGVGGNPNLPLLKRLNSLGVEIYVCAQALAHHGLATTEVAEPVTVAVSAATVNINKQSMGYAYLPFH